MSHADFVTAARAGTLKAHMPPRLAADFLSRRLLLPFFVMPFLGAGVALALIGWFVSGVLVFLVGFIVPRWIKRNAPSILLNQALRDEQLYHDLLGARVLEVGE
jgi:hypothetical protein